MPYDPNIHHRRSIRLKNYDYSQPGAYFVTICTEGRLCLFGDVEDAQMKINEYGSMVQDCWNGLPTHYPQVALDAFIVMPNHVHAIIILSDHLHSESDKVFVPENRHSLDEIVRALKSFSTRSINEHRNTPSMKVWQRNYFEHIVSDEDELYWTRRYILNNPATWNNDIDNPWVQ
jgi:putative transposase